jgi:hypothetical protein
MYSKVAEEDPPVMASVPATEAVVAANPPEVPYQASPPRRLVASVSSR